MPHQMNTFFNSPQMDNYVFNCLTKFKIMFYFRPKYEYIYSFDSLNGKNTHILKPTQKGMLFNP
jgi:hypothetical protein